MPTPLRPAFLALAVCVSIGWLLSGCGVEQPARFASTDYPEQLSAWRIIDSDLQVINRDHTFIYDLASPLFSDYAGKLRTLSLPPNTHAEFAAFESFEFPVGTVVSKTFYYEPGANGTVRTTGQGPLPSAAARPIETRLLVRQAEGWDALPYIWRGDDAYLSITGGLLELATESGDVLNYLVPSKNQCASCHATNHTTGDLQPIGLKARHLHKSHFAKETNQLTLLETRGWLTGLPPLEEVPSNADYTDGATSLDHRARSYLDINCGHCHNPAGAADTSGLLLDYQDHDAGSLGYCKPPIAAGRGSGGRMFSIVPGQPDASILTFRMASSDPAVMMPELGRTLVHTEGLALIDAWVASLSGECR